MEASAVRKQMLAATEEFVPREDLFDVARRRAGRRAARRRVGVVSLAGVLALVTMFAVSAPANTSVSNGTARLAIPESWVTHRPTPCPGTPYPVVRAGDGYDGECQPQGGDDPGVLLYRVSFGFDVQPHLRDGVVGRLAEQSVLWLDLGGGERSYLFPELDLVVRARPFADAAVVRVLESVERRPDIVADTGDRARCYADAAAAEPEDVDVLAGGESPALTCALRWRQGLVGPDATQVPSLAACDTADLSGQYRVLPGGMASCHRRGLDAIDFGTLVGRFDGPSHKTYTEHGILPATGD